MEGKFDFSLDGHFVCVVFSSIDNKLHIGFTTNLQIQLLERNPAKTSSTKRRKQYRKPQRESFRLIYYEFFSNEADAKARVTFLKSSGGMDQLKVVLKRTLSNMGYKNL